MGLKVAGANLVYNGGLLQGTKYLGLIDSGGDEFTGNSYARIAVSGFSGGSADWQVDGNQYENKAAETFPQPQGGAWPAISAWGLYDASSAGNVLFDLDITDTAAPQIGAMVSAMAEAIAFGISGATNMGSLLAMSEGIFAGTRAFTLHTGDPGTTGAQVIFTDGVVWNGSNQAGKTVLSRSVVTANWSYDNVTGPHRRRARNAELSYGAQQADLPDPTYVALRNGTAHDSGVLWSSALTAADPGLGYTLTFAANAFTFYLPIDNPSA